MEEQLLHLASPQPGPKSLLPQTEAEGGREVGSGGGGGGRGRKIRRGSSSRQLGSFPARQPVKED